MCSHALVRDRISNPPLSTPLGIRATSDNVGCFIGVAENKVQQSRHKHLNSKQLDLLLVADLLETCWRNACQGLVN